MNKHLHFVRDNWFKLAIAALLLFLVFKNDLTIQMNVAGPSNSNSSEPPALVRKPFRERLTDWFSTDTEIQPARMDLKPFANASDFTAVTELSKISGSIKEAFIGRFQRVASEEQKKFGIPASIILANALLISRAGESPQVQNGLNFFGLPCTEDWQGTREMAAGTCFRAYESAWMSFRDHSLYLTTGTFSSTQALKGKDYSAWALHLEESGFEPIPNYSMQVLEVIQTYNLDRWD